MGQAKTAPGPARYVLDTAGILEGLNLPAASCWTTPSVLDEIKDQGATGRRKQNLLAAGLRTADPTAASRERVAAPASAAGNASRLSETDVSIIALALDRTGILVTDDHTVQDVADRLRVAWRPAVGKGIAATMDWTARCTGCKRDYQAFEAGQACAVCGAQIRLRRRGPHPPR